jgi:hypothetical protein
MFNITRIITIAVFIDNSFLYLYYLNLLANMLCPRGEFGCADGYCVVIAMRCDGHIDCPYDTSDEDGCRMSFKTSIVSMSYLISAHILQPLVL